MLFDRFDDMRAKIMQGGGGSGEGGFDLSTIGTKVLGEATANLPKGSLWEGIRNNSQTLSLYSSNIVSNIPSNTTPDGKIGTKLSGTAFFTSQTQTLDLYFYVNGAYQISSIDLSTVIPQLGIDTLETNGKVYRISNNFSSNSKLLMFKVYPSPNTNYGFDFAGKNKVLILELDYENRTATPYICQLNSSVLWSYMIGDYFCRF